MNNWEKEWERKGKVFQARCEKDYAQFMEDLRSPLEAQKRVLFDVISQGKKTRFGKENKYDEIFSIEDFQKNIPLRGYQKFEPYIEAEVQNRGGVFSNSPLIRWLKTSGSTGSSKKIPYTQHWMSNYRVPALGVLWANYLRQAPDMLSHPYAILDTQTVREHPESFLNVIPYQGITNRYPLIDETDWHVPWFDAPWFTESVPEGYSHRMYYRLRYLIGQDLRAILAINPSTLVAIKQHLENFSSRLVEDVRHGTLDGVKCFDPNPDFANKLQKILNSDFNLKMLWPNLSLISSWTSASAALYLPEIEKLYPQVKLMPFMSCGTEGIVTLPVDEHPVTGPLAINQGFYEFLPASADVKKMVESGDCPETLLFNELKLGEEYHLIMTQASGMARYVVGDLFKVTGFYKGVPRIEYSRRAGTCYSFTGEKLTESQLLNVINKVIDRYDLHGSLFMCCPVWSVIPYYKILLEVGPDYQNANFKALLEHSINEELKSINEEYKSKIDSGRLGGFKVDFVYKGTIHQYIEKQKTHSNAVQYKYKPFQKDKEAYEQVLGMAA